MSQVSESFVALRIMIATVVKSGSNKPDTAGQYLRDAALEAGHQVLDNVLVAEDRYSLRADISKWIADSEVQVIIINGGTGMTERDQVPEALMPLLDREIAGFGELFRMLSYEDIATSSLQSRAVAGLANQTLIFAVPGSPNACRTAWENIISPQLDARQRPCNFHSYLKK